MAIASITYGAPAPASDPASEQEEAASSRILISPGAPRRVSQRPTPRPRIRPPAPPSSGSLVLYAPQAEATEAEATEEEDSAQAPVRLLDGSADITDLRAAAENMRAVDLAVAPGRVVDLQASDADLAAINERHPGLNLGASDIQMFRDFAVSTGPMRGHRLRFTRSALERFQALAAEGRPYNLHHDPQRYVGTTLRAQIVERQVRGVDAAWLAVDWYAITRDASEQRRQDLMDVRTGLQYTSIRFMGGDWELQELEGPDGPEFFMLIDDNPRDDAQLAFDRLDMSHISRVELGAVKGAGADPETS